MDKNPSPAGALRDFLVDRAGKVAGIAGRKVFGLPLHLSLPIAAAFGVALIVIAANYPARRRRRSLEQRTV